MNLLLSEPEVLLGVTRPCTHHLTLNHLIMLGKYFLYINMLNNTTFAFSKFISLVQDKIEIEKYIAAMLHGERGHLKNLLYKLCPVSRIVSFPEWSLQNCSRCSSEKHVVRA